MQPDDITDVVADDGSAKVKVGRSAVALLGRPQAALMVIIEGVGEEAVSVAGRVFEGGCRFVQYREKRASRSEILETVRRIVTLAHRHEALVVVNDHVDVALLAKAGGVHLGASDLPPIEARTLLGPEAVVGATAHDRAGLDAALDQQVDYVGLGTIFPSPSKPDLPARGVSLIRDLAPHCGVPLYAIGGITASRALECLEAGAVGVAVASAVTSAEDVAAATKEVLGAVKLMGPG